MSNRQYEIPRGHVDGTPVGNIQSRTVSPMVPAHDVPWSSQQPHARPSVNNTQPYRDNDDFYASQPANAYSQEGHPYDSQAPNYYPGASRAPYQTYASHQRGQSHSSAAPLMQPGAAQANPRPGPYPSASSPVPYQTSQNSLSNPMGSTADFGNRMPRASSYSHADAYDDIDPWDIADDGDDDGLEDRSHHRNSRAGLAAAAGAGAGVGAGMLKAFNSRNTSGNYGPVSNGAAQGSEKSEWLRKQSSGSKRLRWIVIIGVALVIIGAIVGGVLAAVLSNHSKSSSTTSSGDGSSLYDLHSSPVQSVLNNANLHKVFPGMDYTPLNAQYPACLTIPPDQNNVTLDVAVMSQLTPTIRLYGTDCNQTEMVLEAISRLGMNDTMKVWIGVYLNSNTSTNDRQISQMYDIVAKYPTSAFAGVIVGNEVLYSKYLTLAELESQISDVRTNLSAQNIHLPVATADLGVSWSNNPSLADSSDIVMSNVHPFFAGVVAADGANWAWSFWDSTDVPLTAHTTETISGTNTQYPTQIISEIGWPSEGGHDCGGSPTENYGCQTSDDGAVANITNINTFMNVWVCQALANGTMYFWFEAIDQPWQSIFNTDDDHWESHWGLFDVNRNLKDGITIPDCGGKTVDSTYLLPASSSSSSSSSSSTKEKRKKKRTTGASLLGNPQRSRMIKR